MEVIAINASPRMDKENTALILEPFLEGIKEKGALVELFYTKKLKINPCHGVFTCWFKTREGAFNRTTCLFCSTSWHGRTSGSWLPLSM